MRGGTPTPAGAREGSTGGDCDAGVGEGACTQLLLLLLGFEAPPAVEGAEADAASLRPWQQLREVGLGPFLFLCGRRTTRCGGGLHVVIQRPIDMTLPPLVERCLRHAGREKRGRPSPQLRCLQLMPLRDPLLGAVVEGPALCVAEEQLVTVSDATGEAVTDSTEDEHDATEAGKGAGELSVAEAVLLPSLLQQASAWSVALLSRCGAVPGGRAGVDMAVRALCYLQQATAARPPQAPPVDIVGIVVDWAAVLHDALAASPRPLAQVTHNAAAAKEATPAWLPLALAPAQAFPAGSEEAPPPPEETLGAAGRLTPPRPLGPDSLAKRRSGSRGSSTSVETAREAGALQTQGNLPMPGQMPRRAVASAATAPTLPFMSVCSEALEAAFQLQQSRTPFRPSHVKHSAGDAGVAAEAGDAAVACREASSCGGGVALFGAAPASATHSPEACDEPVAGAGGEEEEGFLPSLIHRLVAVCHAPVNRRLAGHLSRIAEGDFFPSRTMLEKADLLRQRLGKTLVVRFYDLDPQKPLQQHPRQPCLHESPTAQSGSSASWLAAEFLSSAEHPCYLFLTHTDIVLVSAFDANNPPSSDWAARDSKRAASNPVFIANSRSSSSSSSSSRRCCCSNSSSAAVGDDGGRSVDDALDDAPMYMKHTFVIPRVSLMDVRRSQNAADASMATVLRLQTRSCRRVWLGFQEISELQHVYLELNSGLQTSSGNRFLASAQRHWRMMALTLVAGNVLPTPHTAFYQQVLQNLLTAFADVESRREHRTTASAGGSADAAPLAKDVADCQGALTTLSYSWWLYSPVREYVRQGVPPRQWRLSSVNSRYEHFPSYPARFVVPGCLEDDVLIQSASLRARMRVEALSYYCSSTGAGIVRAAQPAAANICASASKVDAVKSYRRACGMQVCTFDLRSRINAYANTVVGGGFSMETGRYCCLSNIHVVREAYEALLAAVLDNNPSFIAVMRAAGKMATARNDATASATSCGPAATVEATAKAAAAWMEHIHGLLRTATDAARLITGVSEDEALAPAIGGTAAGAPRSVMRAPGAASPNGGGGAGKNFGGLNDRVLPRSSTVYVWTRAFSLIPFRGRSSWRCGACGGGAWRFWPQKQQNAQQPPPSPPSYTQPDSRKHAQLVVVNCSDGWDRTSQVCALTQLLIDPYFRTVEGFITLLEKEFVSFGHPCLLRSSTLQSHSDVSMGTTLTDGAHVGTHDSYKDPASENCQSSPILLQFLDAVQQLLRLYPHCFEFTEAFLLLILGLMHAGVLGTFAVNCEGDVLRWGVAQQTLSLGQFFAVLFATTIRTGDTPPGEATEDGESFSDAAEAPPGCGFPASPAVPLRCFYRSCGGGATLQGVGWDSTAAAGGGGGAPRRIPVSYDAMCHSGLFNPHFSLADNKLLFGPLVDVVRPLQLQLWERFFLRHSFWCERPARLREFSEQSASTVYARLVAPRPATTPATAGIMAASAFAPPPATEPLPQPAREARRPRTAPTEVGEAAPLRLHGAAAPQPSLTRKPSNPAVPVGRPDAARGGSQFFPGTPHRVASFGALQPLEQLQQLSASPPLCQRGATGLVRIVGHALSGHRNPLTDGSGVPRRHLSTAPSNGVEPLGSPSFGAPDGTRCTQQQSASTEPAGAQAHSYNALLDELDQAFD
ncbi:4-nitrophenylphosphatase/protein-tyrosine phosphatase [Trypanosoma conorhini]|uniref:4-nitrophenylphosphatase/protein-tyrosine phosphatase n=1 Tax=Trypanosoma conorhini TaxID=83891 RepID=A0A422Q8Q9_9TRYP|nr:4-nitrophenylphosphatase/protein-tyrosine phosphatase [Trypanosoma conorhini]RNF26346.1 4-nitrophenylphosphatase/protein-tyrosine phosphatase [Trypanosoma conorhini]